MNVGDVVSGMGSLFDCRQLLARLCLIREELSVVAAGQGSDASGSDFAEAKVTYQRLIPQGTAAFVKEMLGVSSKDKRQVTLFSPARALCGQFCSCYIIVLLPFLWTVPVLLSVTSIQM